MVKSSIFWQQPWTNLFEKFDFLDLFETSLFWSKIFSFLSRILKKNLFCIGLPKKPAWLKAQFFDKNHGLTSLKNLIFCTFLKLHFSGLKFILFYPEYLKTIFSGLVCLKIPHGKKFIFLTKPWTNPFKKSDFRTFLKLHFSGLKSILFYSEY